jgi:hypothetical protein
MIRHGSTKLCCVVPDCSWWFSRCVSGTFLLVIWWGKFVWTLCGSLVLVSLPNLWVKGLDFGVFGVLGLELFLWVDFRFLLIKWVLGTELRAKGSPRGTPSNPKVSLWSVERIERSIGGRFEFSSRVEFFPTVQTKTGLTGFPNRSDRFSPAGCREEFFEQGSPCCSMAILVHRRRGSWSKKGFWEFLDRTGLTGLPNRSDRFPLPVWG